MEHQSMFSSICTLYTYTCSYYILRCFFLHRFCWPADSWCFLVFIWNLWCFGWNENNMAFSCSVCAVLCVCTTQNWLAVHFLVDCLFRRTVVDKMRRNNMHHCPNHNYKPEQRWMNVKAKRSVHSNKHRNWVHVY